MRCRCPSRRTLDPVRIQVVMVQVRSTNRHSFFLQAISIQDGGRELLDALPLPFEAGAAAAPTPARRRRAASVAAPASSSDEEVCLLCSAYRSAVLHGLLCGALDR